MIELGTGFHPELTGQENVLLNTSIHGLSRAEALEVYDGVVAYSGLRHFMDVPLKNYSSGMTMRLGFAIAATMDPDVLLLDEIFAVGDADFQRQCMATLKAFQARGKTIMFVSHSSAAVQAVCRRVAHPRSRSAAVRWRRGLGPDGVSPPDGALRRTRRSGPQPGETVEAAATAPPARVRRSGPRVAPAGRRRISGRRKARGSTTSCADRGCSRITMLDVGCGSLSAASRLLPLHASEPLLGIREEHRALPRRAPRSSCPAPACDPSSDTSS